MTPKQFRNLASSYGADLRRWPEADRAAAAALLRTSVEAQLILDSAQDVDFLLEEAAAAYDSHVWQEGEADAALARVRARVAARTAAPLPDRSWLGSLAGRVRFGPGRPTIVTPFRLGTSTGLAIALFLGFWIGWAQVSPQPSAGVLDVLQSTLMSGVSLQASSSG